MAVSVSINNLHSTTKRLEAMAVRGAWKREQAGMPEGAQLASRLFQIARSRAYHGSSRLAYSNVGQAACRVEAFEI
jgi:hypothetical protein